MKPFKVKEFTGALRKKGFQLDRKTSDEIYYFWFEGTKTSVWTKASMGRGEELRSKLLGIIQRQLYFDTQKQLGEFIDCPIGYQEYAAHLRSKGILRDSTKES